MTDYNHGVVDGELARLMVEQHRAAVAKGIVQCAVCDANGQVNP